MKFVFNTTRTYSGGNVVLRELCLRLAKRGHDARIIADYTFDDLSHPTGRMVLVWKSLLNIGRDIAKWFLVKLGVREDPFDSQQCRKKHFPFVGKDTIVVYQEGVYGNPFHAKRVVRWFLFHNRYPNDPEAYKPCDLVFSYREFFNDYTLNPTCRLLSLNHFNSALYRQTNFGERSGNCYFIHKGWTRPDLPKEFDGPVIDYLTEKKKVEVLNRCKYFYSYDTQTFYNIIATVCGCISIVVMEPGKTKEDYLGKGDRDNGRAYGDSPEEIERSLGTRDKVLKGLDYEEANKRSVDYFLQEVGKRFGPMSYEEGCSPQGVTS